MAKRKANKPDKSTPTIPAKDAGVNLFDIAAPLSETVQIKDVFLAESRLLRGVKSEEEIPTGYLKIRIHDSQQALIGETNSFWVKIPFSLIATREREDKEQDNVIFTIEASFVLTYECATPEILDEVTIEAFAKTNGVYNAWPYWRELAQSMTSRMGLPPVTLPVFRLS